MLDTSMDRWTRLRAEANHFMVRRLGPVARTVTRLHARFPDSRVSRLYNRLWLSAPVFNLTVRGRKTGELRTVSLILTRRADDLLVVGSNAASPSVPAWFLNLRAAGVATVEVDGRSRPVSFREVTDPDERAACQQLITAVYPGIDAYAVHASRTFPIGVLTPAA